jgi:NADH-quinone oxidoreductase subunit L
MTVPLIVLGILSVCSAWGGWFQHYITKPDLQTYATVQTIEGHAGTHLPATGEHGEADHGTRLGDPHETETPLATAHEGYDPHDELAQHGTAVAEEHGEAVSHGGDHAGGDHHDVAHTAHNIAMILSIIIAFSGIGIAYLTYMKEKISADRIAERFKGIHTVLSNKYYIDEFYGKTFIALTLGVSRVCRWIDTYIIDGIVNGVARLTVLTSDIHGKFDNIVIDGMVNTVADFSIAAGGKLRKLQTGRVQNYILWVVLILLVIFYIRVF